MLQPQEPRKRVARYGAALLLGFFALAGCSKLKFALGLAPWYAEKLVKAELPPLTPGQQRLLTSEIQHYWAWYKRHMMPADGATLRRLAAGLSSTAATDPKDLALSSALVTGLYDQSVEPLLRPAALFLRTLDGAQINALEEIFRKDQAKQRARYLEDPEKTFRVRVDKLRGSLEDWAGKFSPAQRVQLETLSRNFNIPYQAWLNDKARREAELIKALREHRSEAGLETLLHEWWLRSRTGGEDREPWQWDEAALQMQLQGIVGLLEAPQRQRMSGKLADLAQELERLAMEPIAVEKPTAIK